MILHSTLPSYLTEFRTNSSFQLNNPFSTSQTKTRTNDPMIIDPFRKMINSIENWIKIQKKREKIPTQRFRKLYISNGAFTAITVCIETMNNYTNARTFWKTSLSRIVDYYLGHVSFVRSFVRNVFNKPPLPSQPLYRGRVTGFKGAWKNKVQFVRGSLVPYIEIHRSEFPPKLLN